MIYFIITIILSLLLSFAIYRISLRQKWLDIPNEERRVHQKPTPNLGGIAMFLSFWIMMGAFLYFNHVQGFYLKYIAGLFLGSSILFITGIIDDRKKIKPGLKFAVQVLSALIIITSGIGITYITNPFGGLIYLDQIQIPFLNISGTIYKITLIADIFALLWIVGKINIFNFLDGLDGLASGVAAIAFFVIFALSIHPSVNQPLSATIALIMLGAVLGFLPFNLNPAKMFMGDTGSMFLGFMLSTLAIIAGGKVATILLVLGLPIFDGFWVVTTRIFQKKKPWEAGKDHFHHKLLELGIAKRGVVLVFWGVTALFGSISLVSGALGKLIALIILLLILITGMIVIEVLLKVKKEKSPD